MRTKYDPVYPMDDMQYDYRGLTKRELIAAMAMQGYLASFAGIGDGDMTAKNIAIESVSYADALLEALK